MPAAWELSDAQRQAAAQRAWVAHLERWWDRLDAERAIAAGAEEELFRQRDALRARASAIRFGPRPVRVVDHGAYKRATNDPTDDELREYDAIEEQIRVLESRRERWLAEHVVRWHDGAGVEHSYTLTTSGVDQQRGRLRVDLDCARSRLAELEAALSPGELVQAGAPSDQYVDYRDKVAKLRARMA